MQIILSKLNDFGNKIDISDDFSEKFIDYVYNCYMQE